MEMNMFNWFTMHLGLSFRNDPEDPERYGQCMLRQVSGSEDLLNIRQISSMMVMMMLMLMTVFIVMMLMLVAVFRNTVGMQIRHIMIMILMLCVKHDVKVTCIQRRFLHSADHNLRAFQMKTVQRMQQDILIRTQIQQSCHCHISADSAHAVQYQRLFIEITYHFVHPISLYI